MYCLQWKNYRPHINFVTPHTIRRDIFIHCKTSWRGILLVSKLGYNFTCMPVGDSFHFVCRFCLFRIFDQLIINLQWGDRSRDGLSVFYGHISGETLAINIDCENFRTLLSTDGGRNDKSSVCCAHMARHEDRLSCQSCVIFLLTAVRTWNLTILVKSVLCNLHVVILGHSIIHHQWLHSPYKDLGRLTPEV
jgi:hypothetical protein